MKNEFWKFAASENALLHCFAFYVAGCFTSVLFVVAEPSAASASAARGPSLRAHRGRSLRFSAERFRCTDAWKNNEKYIVYIYMNMFKSSDEFGKSLFFEIQLFLCFFEIIWNSIKKIVEVHHHPEDLQKWFAIHAGPLKQALQKCYG